MEKEYKSYCSNCNKSNVDYTIKRKLAKCNIRKEDNRLIDYKESMDYEYVAKVAYCKECGNVASLSGKFNNENVKLANTKIRIKLDILTAQEVKDIIDFIGKEKVVEHLGHSVDDMYKGFSISKKTSDKLKELLEVKDHKM